MEIVVNTYFLRKDLLHHPIDSQLFINGWLSGSKWYSCEISLIVMGLFKSHWSQDCQTGNMKDDRCVLSKSNISFQFLHSVG